MAALRWRLRGRWLLECLRPGALGALAGSGLIAIAGRLFVVESWPLAAIGWSSLAAVVALVWRRSSWPDLHATALAADTLGLEERVASALDARTAGHPAAELLQQDAMRVLARLRSDRYPLVPRPGAWRAVAFVTVGFMILATVPLPTVGDRAYQSDQARVVATARRALDRPTAELTRLSADPLLASAAAELRELDRALADTATTKEAADRLEAAQERLAALGRADEFAWRRALDAMAEAWMRDPELRDLARSLRTHDETSVQRVVEGLMNKEGAANSDEIRRLALGLQAGANAARDVPSVASALREAASELRSPSEGDARDAEAEMGELLAKAAGRAGALNATQQAVASVGAARAAIGAASASSGAVASGRASSRSGGSARGGSQGGQSSGSGSTNQASVTTGSSSGSTSAGAQAGGSGGQGGSGGGSIAASSSGNGGMGAGAGSGTGAGAGAGGGPSSGQPGSTNSGATTSGGGRRPPGSGATSIYSPMAGPSLLGGEGGAEVALSGDVADASGETVELRDSPITLGAIRPYEAVYPEYEASARQSLTRQALPPALETLVQRYFTSIAPTGASEP